MAIILEDGTGLSTSETYISVDDCDLYHTNRLNDSWSDGTDDEKEAALRRAMAYIEGRYGPRYSGVRVNGRDQALMWPRVGAQDSEGWTIDSDVVPLEVKRAVAEAALRELAEPGALAPDVTTTSGAVTRKREKVGPLEVETEYATGENATGAAERLRPVLLMLDDVMAPLLSGLGGSFGTIPLVRN